MIVIREIKVDTEEFEIGDIIAFPLNDGERVKAVAVDHTPHGILFVMADCLEGEYPMFNNSENLRCEDICYFNSDLRKVLNGEILNNFPEIIRSRMRDVNDAGDKLRIPTEKEIRGINLYG